MNTHEKEIIAYLKPFSKNNDVVFELLVVSVGRILNRAAKKNDNWHSLCDDQKIRHISDWFLADVNKEASWINHKDALGRVKKMLKFSDIDGIVREANKVMTINNNMNPVFLSNQDEELYANLSDGYYLVKLLTPAALDRESVVMQHCIGQGAYDDALTDDKYNFLSLRDAYGKPHVTLEIKNKGIEQIQGKQNEPPRNDYLLKIVEYFSSTDINMSYALEEMSLVLSEDNQIYSLNEQLPKNFFTKSDLIISLQNGIKLPKGLNVKGNLIISGSHVKHVSDVNVQGKIGLQALSQLKSISNIKVGDSIRLDFCSQFTNLPNNLVVPGDLSIRECKKFKKLPDGLSVGDTLDISGTNVTFIPSDIEIGRKLKITGTSIDPKDLPDTLSNKLIIVKNPLEGEKTLGSIRKKATKELKIKEEESQILKF